MKKKIGVQTLILFAVIASACLAIGQTGDELGDDDENNTINDDSCLIMVGKKLFALKDKMSGYEVEVSR